MNILETVKVTYEYRGGIKALDEVSISVPENGAVALLGSNGAGKSTLMLHFNGILFPTSGKVIVDGEEVTKKNIKQIRQKIGMVFQDSDDQIFAPTVREDIAFGPTNMGLKPDEINERVDNALSLLEITHLKDRPPHQLSGGEKKRVAIAGILAMNPRILVLDEPTSGLDPAGCRDILCLLQTFVREKGISIIFSTHNVELVPELADYIYVMHRGRVIGQGTVNSVFSSRDLLNAGKLEQPVLSRLVTSLNDRGIFLNTGHKFVEVLDAVTNRISPKL